MAGSIPPQDPLDFPLSQPLDPDKEILVLQCLWQRSVSQKDVNKYQSYLKYYGEEMRRLRFSLLKELQPLCRTAAQTHADVIKVIVTLSEHRNLPLSDVQGRLSAVFQGSSEEAIQNSIDLALRVWLTLNVRNESMAFQILHTGVPIVHWKSEGTSLVEFVAQTFSPKNLVQIDPTEKHVDHQLTAAYLSRACSVRIEWTTCVADHLRYSVWEGERVVRIYELKQCAFDHMNGFGTSLTTSSGHGQSIYPARVLQELIWSLNQLFPVDDRHTQHLLSGSNKTFNRDGPLDRHRPTDLNEYHYFREKLLELRRVSKAEPENFKEMIHKRQSYDTKIQVILTIVLGFILATIFGFIASVTAIISAKAAIQGLHVAQRAYDMQKQVPICPCSS